MNVGVQASAIALGYSYTDCVMWKLINYSHQRRQPRKSHSEHLIALGRLTDEQVVRNMNQVLINELNVCQLI